MAVGLVIDWWMTERFEDQLVSQMHHYLDDLERTLLDGSGQNDGAGQNGGTENLDKQKPDGRFESHVGLRQALPRFCRQLRSAYRDRFFQQIVLGDTP